ncbi:hypothetical protein IC607_11360 [Cellulomonas sp. JH27-2]|uniref:hypothetical protein n=1 Tax=Cellulomonas sp. JH27-2 TaxID=2774139 RepID=UPI00178477C4|nr:hypothetical protein [Cellulomonas sp. JH27-2]MBD8059563.1 hypothetical protein [Cellulomonas sp. JH27-2]
MTVKVDKDVLAATVVALDNLEAQLPSLFSRAANLDARIDMAGLNGAEAWAAETSKDLRGRIGVLEQLAQAQPTFGGVRMNAAQAIEIAGQKMHVEDALLALRATGTAADAWDNEDPANLSEWFDQLEAEALDKLAQMNDSEQAQALVDGYHDIQNLISASNAAVVTTTQILLKGGPALVRWLGEHHVTAALERLAQSNPKLANWLSGALQMADTQILRAKTTFTYPGAFVPNLTQKMLLKAAPVAENFDEWVARMAARTKPFEVMVNGVPVEQPTLLAKLLQGQSGTKVTAWVSDVLKTTNLGQLTTTAARWGNNVFGRAWTNPTTGATFGRGAGNLLTMANESGLRTMASSAGALRILGVAGSAFATADGVVGLVNNFDENNKLWSEGGTKGKAHVVGEYAETAFNASMTAALIAPNPVTIGLVAVTGVVWAGAEVVEHWDDITHAADEAVDWAGDRVDDAKDWAEDRLDDIKDSKVNPMNWF